ncbi:hypothetical protein H920_05268 [Fukomys damarensis]|uniref:Uncharacterized protein n=1 Tax=Fukomys damarensis TaxID=885580 RepID=A0A091DSW2_FUKDA|nr:hypothetical protein H920_05268 [Fukomys damarensis]
MRHRKPAAAVTAPGFGPDPRRWLLGSGFSSTLTREPSRSLNIRYQRLVRTRISGGWSERVVKVRLCRCIY